MVCGWETPQPVVQLQPSSASQLLALSISPAVLTSDAAACSSSRCLAHCSSSTDKQPTPSARPPPYARTIVA
eukprot:751317-Hanusia_phi.AAC.1